MKKILVITYYYPPSGGSGVQRWMYFTKYFRDFGFDPYVITVDEKAASYKFLDPAFLNHVQNVKIFRTKTREPLKYYSRMAGGDERTEIPQGFAGESDPGIFRKLSRFIRGNFFIPDARIGWNKFAYEKAAELIPKENIRLVITNGTPHSTHLVGLKLKREFEINWISDFRDPWIEAHYNKQLYRTWLAEKIDKRLEWQVLTESDFITTIGPGMQKLLIHKLPWEDREKVKVVYNGFDAESFVGIEKCSAKKFSMLHLGMLSENQPVTAFVTALKNVLQANASMTERIRLQLIGQVSPSIVQEVRVELKDLEIEVIGYIPHKEAIQYMMDADLLLNSLAETGESALLISGKMMEYIATGNPILALGNTTGDAAALLNKIPHARIFDRRDVGSIEKFILEIYRNWEKGIRYEKTNIDQYSRYETTRQYAEILSELI